MWGPTSQSYVIEKIRRKICQNEGLKHLAVKTNLFLKKYIRIDLQLLFPGV